MDFSSKQTAISLSIRKILRRDQLYSLLNCIDIEDIHDFLTEYVYREKSVEKISKMYHAAVSLPTQIGMDCIEHMMSFLDIRDLASMSCVNAEFNEMCSKPKQKNLENISKVDDRPMVEILNNPPPRNESLPYFLRPFPHEDPFHIDMRTIIKGDGKTYPKRWSGVIYEFTGQWRRNQGCTEWLEVSSPENPMVCANLIGRNELTIGFEQALRAMSLYERARIWIPHRLGNLDGPNHADYVCELTVVVVEHFGDGVAAPPPPMVPRQPLQPTYQVQPPPPMAHLPRFDDAVSVSVDGNEDDRLSSHCRPLDVRVHTQFWKESKSFCIDNEELDETMLNTNDEDGPHFDVDAMYVMDCRRDKYRRKIQSKRKQENRRRLKREYRKRDGKSKENRIRRKMRKYRTIDF